jgi:hypothetical protein
MKIYLAGGFSVINVKNRERELSEKFQSWNRLFSFYFVELIHKSEILKLIKDNEAILSCNSSRK